MTRRQLRPLLALFLSLVLFGTSVTMAVARGQVQVAGQIVICSGYGVTTIDVDDNGNPVGPVHICPDCVMAFFASVGVEAPQVFRPETRSVRLVAAPVRQLQSHREQFFRARDPPLSV